LHGQARRTVVRIGSLVTTPRAQQQGQDGQVARFGDGFAADADLVRAAESAAAEALRPLAGRRPDLACIFVSGSDTDAVAEAGARAAMAVGALSTIGCNAPGVIGSGRAAESTSAVSVWCAVLPDVRARTFHLEAMPATSGLAVVGMPERLPDDVVGVLLADPWSFPIDGFIERSNDALDGLPLVGGIAAGARGRGSTRLFLDGSTVDRGAVGVLLGGPVGARAFVSQGCRPIGPAMTVTAADGNLIIELAGTPAITKLEEILSTLDAQSQALATTGLQIGVAMDDYAEEHVQGDFLIRGIAGSEASNGGLIVGEVVAVGRTVQFQLRDAAAADADLRDALKRFRESAGLDTIEGALLFSCNGRGAQLFARADHDVTMVREGLATDGVAGFFAAGEIGPVAGRNHVHGLTAAVLAFGSGAVAERGTRQAARPAVDG
jgi:small ligand-binding sensory domain FIST